MENEQCNTIEESDKQSKLHFIQEMISDIGTCRKVNQDACCVRMMNVEDHTLIMAVVCDGVGGLQEGDYASKSTIQTLNNWFDYTVSRNIHGKDQAQLLDYLQNEVEHCIQKQNRMLWEYALEKEIRTGTTLTLMVILDRKYLIAQIGDSRAYCINEELIQLTEDQSVVAREIKAGRLSKESAKHDKRRNMILQCIGGAESVCIDYQRGNVVTGDVFFLCSDGFIHELEDDEIKEFLNPSILSDRVSVKECLKSAVEEVKRRGEKDNITVVLVKVNEKV
ncbi:MAG: protein phosphatase 2C domain-containing protein [Eubacterium sp.]|nr:protein phosphatase 2C domain-containing protein [Eubacterium sp.]